MGNRLRGAMIGYGFIGAGGHAPAYLERARGRGDFEIVAVADTCDARRHEALAALPGVRVYPNHSDLLAAEAGGLDFVDIATPPCDHATVARAALERGLHVLCEKPLTTSIEAARALLARAEEVGCVVFPCHNYKHAPVVKAIRHIIQSGRIGAVSLVTLSTFRHTHARGVVEWRPDWRRERHIAGGGIGMDHGSHTFYLAFEWLGSYPTAITAKTRSLLPFDTEDNFACTLTFPNGMAMAQLTWTAGVRKVIYTVHGDRGAVRVEDDDLEIAELCSRTDARRTSGGAHFTLERHSIASEWMDASHVTWFGSLLDEFKHAIVTRDYVGREAREALLCVRLINAAYASALAGSREISLLTDRVERASA